MMNYPVRIIREAEDKTFFRLIYRKDIIRRGLECLCQQGFMQGKDIRFTVLVVNPDPVCPCLPSAGFLIGEPQVFNGDYLLI